MAGNKKAVAIYRWICIDSENDEWHTVALSSTCCVKDILRALSKREIEVDGKVLVDTTNVNHPVS